MIIPVFKPLGKSTHQLAQKLGKIYGEKATHTGTLDPMAEGVVIVLTGDDRFGKENFGNWKKNYTFQMLIGVSTDSHDLLGLTTSQPFDLTYKHDGAQLESLIQNLLPDFLGRQQQRIPSFSAKRFDGKSYFDAAKAGEKLPSSAEEIEIYELNLKNIEAIETDRLLLLISHKIIQVEGDFRQKQILQNWEKYFSVTQLEYYYLVSMSAVTSKRTYIRGLVRDLGMALSKNATTFSIVRTANGPYQIEDCICLL